MLVSLLLGTFVTGSAELLTVGLLPLISSGLGVSVAAAGAVFSAYALRLATGGPLLTAATIRLDRRPFWWARWLFSQCWSSPPRHCRTSDGSSPHDWGGRTAGHVHGRGVHDGHVGRPERARRPDRRQPSSLG